MDLNSHPDMFVIPPIPWPEPVKVTEWDERNQILCTRKSGMSDLADALHVLVCMKEGRGPDPGCCKAVALREENGV